MTEKRRCENCGAFLSPEDKLCYVCGEVQPVVPQAEEPEKDVPEPQVEIPETNVKEIEEPSAEPEIPSGDEEPAPRAERRKPREKDSSKKPLVIALVCIIVLVFAAGAVCVSLFTGKLHFGSEPAGDEVTIYFDCPKSAKTLTAKDGTIYYWTGNVEISYDADGKTQTKSCSICNDTNSLWKVSIPQKSKNVFFFQDLNKNVRTRNLPVLKNETVYYVTKAEFDSKLRLFVGFCDRDEFSNLGINAADLPEEKKTVLPTTPKETEPTTPTEATEPASDKPKDDGKAYTIGYIPDSWKESVFHIDNDRGGATYYEQKNYNAGLGTLMSIYVFDKGDTTFNDWNNVKKKIELDDGRTVVITTPADVQHGDGDLAEAYSKQNAYVSEVIDSIKAK